MPASKKDWTEIPASKAKGNEKAEATVATTLKRRSDGEHKSVAAKKARC